MPKPRRVVFFGSFFCPYKKRDSPKGEKNIARRAKNLFKKFPAGGKLRPQGERRASTKSTRTPIARRAKKHPLPRPLSRFRGRGEKSENPPPAGQKKSSGGKPLELFKKNRQRPTLPRSLPRSTIGSGGLNFRVRDGNGWDPSDIAAVKTNIRRSNFTSKASKQSACSKLRSWLQPCFARRIKTTKPHDRLVLVS